MCRHKTSWIVGCLVVVLLSLPMLSFSAQERRMALVIGNSNYPSGGSLANPISDARAMKKALEGLGFTVLKYENCTQKEMRMAMDEFGSKLKGQDVGLFFYAGHGVQVGGYNYLIPVDASLNNEKKVEYDCVRADRVLADMEHAGIRTAIVILDACRDNPFERSWRRGKAGAGLAFMNAPSGSLIAYSTAPGKTALDGSTGNSPYTAALLEHIGSPDITVLQMFQRVRSSVVQSSSNKQIPWESTSLKGDFYFAALRKDSGIDVERAKLEKERQELERLRKETERRRIEEERAKLEQERRELDRMKAEQQRKERELQERKSKLEIGQKRIGEENQKITSIDETIISKEKLKYYVKLYNIDDEGRVFVNDNLVKKVGYKGDSDWINITDFLKEGNNKVRFELYNGPGGWTYGFKLRKGKDIVWEDECGRAGYRGCNNNDYTSGMIYRKEVQIVW